MSKSVMLPMRGGVKAPREWRPQWLSGSSWFMEIAPPTTTEELEAGKAQICASLTPAPVETIGAMLDEGERRYGHDALVQAAVKRFTDAYGPGKPEETIAEGDAFTIRAGCDKRMETCGAKFANTLNFRGFPLMPGNDCVTSYPRRGEGHSGGSLQ